MTVDSLLRAATRELSLLIPTRQQAFWEARMLLAHALDKDPAWLVAHGQENIPPTSRRLFISLLEKRKKWTPLAYLFGSWSFCGELFLLNRHILIPRPETEELVRLAAEKLSSFTNKPLVFDIGTGSGAIAISLAKLLPHLTIIASDTNHQALTLAKKNAKRILGKKRVPLFVQADLFSNSLQRLIKQKKTKSFCVLANLPYLPPSDRGRLQPEIVKHEPHAALFTKHHGLFLIKKLLKQIDAFQKNHPLLGSVILEFDPPQKNVLKKFASVLFPRSKITIHADQFKRPRFILIRLTLNSGKRQIIRRHLDPRSPARQ